MRTYLVAIALVVFGVSNAHASEMTGRLFAPDKALVARTVMVGATAQATRTRLPAIREVSDIPIIALPKSLRPTRPPAGSPL